ncbi:uncharacterized protein LOC109821183 [Asparagus officinalis]|uniref:uncharacterized protein LOC109821183 n=1 Tax=Asparagus officinalis TaxID=4686 RepID=UPI00098E75F0|nr:uncharacterized protein LOC109821183 [Asparagus officinalis]
MDHSLGAFYRSKNDNGPEQVIYYLSQTMIGTEHRYNPVEKECLALVFAIQKMRNYLTGQSIHKVVNGQAIVDFLAEHLIPESSKLYEDILDKVFESNAISDHQIWQLYFGGASRRNHKGAIVAGVGVVLIDPHGHILPWANSLTDPCSNNVAKFNALIIGLQLAQDMGVKYLEAHSDSKLVVNQMKGEYEVYHNDLMPYQKAATKLAQSFEGFYISYVARLENTHVDDLASLAATLAMTPKSSRHIIVASR